MLIPVTWPGSPSSKLQTLHTSNTVTAQTGSAGLPLTAWPVPRKKNVRFDGGQIYFRASDLLQWSQNPNGKKGEGRCSGVPLACRQTDVQGACAADLKARSIEYTVTVLKYSAREEKQGHASCNGSATGAWRVS